MGAQAKAFTGRPLAATENRRTLQVLADGTRIERKEASKYFRDGEGRTRLESGDGDLVTISNPASGATTQMNTSSRTARQATVLRTLSLSGDKEKFKVAIDGHASGAAGIDGLPEAAPDVKNAKTGNLGIQSINGILADGARTTITIPAGEIGNDRPINIVNERWFSSALGRLVKSVNSDSRFGETTFAN